MRTYICTYIRTYISTLKPMPLCIHWPIYARAHARTHTHSAVSWPTNEAPVLRRYTKRMFNYKQSLAIYISIYIRLLFPGYFLFSKLKYISSAEISKFVGMSGIFTICYF